MAAMLEIVDAEKTFTMHLQGGVRLPAVRGVTFQAHPDECLALAGPSGAGKSSVLKMIFGNYRCDHGRIAVRHDGEMVDMASAAPREVLEIRRRTIGYVSQFLRAVPRVAALDVVAEPLIATGVAREDARARAATVLRRLAVAERLWPLPPATFSGGEQQRVNIARGFVCDLPLLLLDEPTASLDTENRALFVELVAEKKRAGVAMVAIVHDDAVRARIADRTLDISSFDAAA